MKSAMEELNQTYRYAMPAIEQIAARHGGVSGPLFISEPLAYWESGVRLMIVGQQTCGWPDVSVGLEGLLRAYREFDLGREYTASPFWQASHELSRGVNSEGPERGFVWSNLVKVDQYNERPEPEVEDAIWDLALLNRELEVLEPDAVVFFTGPHYEERLRETFPGVRYHMLTPDVVRLAHPDLPANAFRTYHPRYLWQARKRAVLGHIVDAINAA